MLEFKVDSKSYDEFKRLCDLPAKVIPQLKKLFKEPGIFDYYDPSYDDYVGISHQITATERGYDVI